MLELGVKPELDIYDTGHLDLALALHGEGVLAEPPQFSIVLGVRGGATATAENLVHMVGQLPQDCLWQAIGIGSSNLPITMLGLALGATSAPAWRTL